MGEFGRTPKLNAAGGRDHWPRAGSVCLAGGGVKGGQVIGATNDKAEYPTEKPYTPGCVLATMYHALGIDPATEVLNDLKQPRLLVDAKPVLGLFG